MKSAWVATWMRYHRTPATWVHSNCPPALETTASGAGFWYRGGTGWVLTVSGWVVGNPAIPSASIARTEMKYCPSSSPFQRSCPLANVPERSTCVSSASRATMAWYALAPVWAGTFSASNPRSCTAAGSEVRLGAGSRLRGLPTVPSACTASPWPGCRTVAAAVCWAGLSAARDCTATAPCSTAAVVSPDSLKATPNRVPRTLVTARGVRTSKRREASVLGATLDSTLPR